MPIPKPTGNQTEEQYIASCMGNATMVADYPTNAQRYAVCISTWRNRNKSNQSVEVTEMSD